PPVSWSPDSTQVTLLRADGTVIVKSFDGTNERVISTDSIATPPAWSPDGGRIVYAWGSSLVLVRPDGSGPQEVLLEGYNEHPVWSPDSLAIAFISNSYQDSSRQIQVIDVFGRGLTTIYSPTISDSFIEQPVWASNCDTGIKNPAVLAEAGLAAVLAADQETLFWADPGTNKIFRVTKSGGVVQPVADTDPSPDALIVGADSFVYWKTSGGLLSRAISSQNSQAQSLAYGVNSAQLAADDDYIYFGLDDPLEPANNGIVRWGFATQKLEHLADAGVIGGIAVDDAYVYWSTFGDHYEGTGTIRRVPKAGGTPEVIASQQSRPIFLTAAGGQIYWTSSATGVDGPRTGESTVMRADADGQNAVAVMSDQSACRRVTVTDSRIWAVCDDTLYYVPVETDGSIAPTPQSTLQGRYISSIAVDDQWIFAAADAQIVQTPK
ncbi:MAG TPA: hypothetical protein VFG83_08250, partial [Kofleriaceae bacterium]|nr:hypothetical protein [Kofleriaceae bacterium]